MDLSLVRGSNSIAVMIVELRTSLIQHGNDF